MGACFLEAPTQVCGKRRKENAVDRGGQHWVLSGRLPFTSSVSLTLYFLISEWEGAFWWLWPWTLAGMGLGP